MKIAMRNVPFLLAVAVLGLPGGASRAGDDHLRTQVAVETIGNHPTPEDWFANAAVDDPLPRPSIATLEVYESWHEDLEQRAESWGATSPGAAAKAEEWRRRAEVLVRFLGGSVSGEISTPVVPDAPTTGPGVADDPASGGIRFDIAAATVIPRLGARSRQTQPARHHWCETVEPKGTSLVAATGGGIRDADTNWIWNDGHYTELSVAFDVVRKPKKGKTTLEDELDHLADLKSAVEYWAPVWSNYANVRFEFGVDRKPKKKNKKTESDWWEIGVREKVDNRTVHWKGKKWPKDSDIRVTRSAWPESGFKAKATIGKGAGSERKKNKSTMTLVSEDWDEDAWAILHEFGHALGFMHEHQSPVANIEFKPEDEFPEGRLDKKDPDKYENNYGRLDSDGYSHSVYDTTSIMHYGFGEDDERISAGSPVTEVTQDKELSLLDMYWAGLVYPKWKPRSGWASTYSAAKHAPWLAMLPDPYPALMAETPIAGDFEGDGRADIGSALLTGEPVMRPFRRGLYEDTHVCLRRNHYGPQFGSSTSMKAAHRVGDASDHHTEHFSRHLYYDTRVATIGLGHFVHTGDVDGDGKDDLVSTAVSVGRKGARRWMFRPSTSRPEWLVPKSLSVGGMGSGWPPPVQVIPKLGARQLRGESERAVAAGRHGFTFGREQSFVDTRLDAQDIWPLLGDFDGDGADDFAVVSYGSSVGSVSIRLNDGDGRMKPVEINGVLPSGWFQLLSGKTSDIPIAGDFDGDGDDDLGRFMTNLTVNVDHDGDPSTPDVMISAVRIEVLRNGGAGTFASVPYIDQTILMASLADDGKSLTSRGVNGARPLVGRFTDDECDSLCLVQPLRWSNDKKKRPVWERPGAQWSILGCDKSSKGSQPFRLVQNFEDILGGWMPTPDKIADIPYVTWTESRTKTSLRLQVIDGVGR